MHPPPDRLHEIRITLRATGPVRIDRHLGSALRGAWGKALRRLACPASPAGAADGPPGRCATPQPCAYCSVFEPAPAARPLHPSLRDGLPPYTLCVPLLSNPDLPAGATLQAGLMLWPAAWPWRGPVAEALRRGWHRNPAIGDGWLEVDSGSVAEHRLPDTDTPDPAAPEAAVLDFATPLRLQRGGQPLRTGTGIDAATLGRATLTRLLQWRQVHGLPAPAPAAADRLRAAFDALTVDGRGLRWRDGIRYSHAQRRAHPLGGLLGPLHIAGPREALRAVWPLLRLTEHIHLGKETVLGLGRYRLLPA